MNRLAFALAIPMLVAIVPAVAGAAPEAGPQLTPAQAMNAKISEVRFENTQLRDCFEWVRTTLGTNVHVDWGGLAQVGVTPEMPVNMNLRWVTVPRLLRLLLQETGRGDQLAYYVSGNVLNITTKERADGELFTRVYPVEDLVIRPSPIRKRGNMDLGDTGSRRGSGGGGGRSGSGGGGSSGGGDNDIFGRGDDDSGDDDEKESDKGRGQEVIDMVKQLTPPEIWVENGGRSRIAYFRGSLILTAPRSVHELVGGPIRER